MNGNTKLIRKKRLATRKNYLISFIIVPVVRQSRRNCVSCSMHMVGSWSTLHMTVLFSFFCCEQQFFMHLKSLFCVFNYNNNVAYIFTNVMYILLCFFSFLFHSFIFETINVFGYCRFYYIAFRVSLAITLRWSSRNVFWLMMHLLCE